MKTVEGRPAQHVVIVGVVALQYHRVLRQARRGVWLGSGACQERCGAWRAQDGHDLLRNEQEMEKKVREKDGVRINI